MTPRDEWRLDTRRLGRRTLVFDRLDSTNTLAAKFADDPSNDGLAILADEQTAGRGQHGHIWTAPPRVSVLLSLLLFPPPALRRPAVLTAWVAVSVCETVREITSIPARIKWPNDVLVRGKKICGILIEQSKGTVVGIGLNVRQTADDFAAAELPEATSLAHFLSSPPEAAEVARHLLRKLDEEWDRLLNGDLATLEACWKWHVGLLGRMVTVECHEGTHTGRLLEMTFGGIELEQADGSHLLLPPEKVQHVRESRARGLPRIMHLH